MMVDFAELFAQQQTNVIDWNGTRLHGLYQFDEVPRHLHINFVSSKSTPVQGLQIRARGGTLLVNERESSDVVLWRDSAPDSVEVEVHPSAREGELSLKIWNVWRAGTGVTQAWLGNAAMQVNGKPETGRFVLCCSDGQGEPNFGDLVAEVIVE